MEILSRHAKNSSARDDNCRIPGLVAMRAPAALAFPITAMVNALLALPFALRVLAPEVKRVERNYGRLAEGLGMFGWARFRHLEWPQLRGSIGFAAGLAAALSTILLVSTGLCVYIVFRLSDNREQSFV